MNDIKRDIITGDKLASAIKAGVDKLSDTVKSTMGPKGKLVLIQRENEHPIVTKDGVTVANAINLHNELENLGARVIRESASRTADEAGDGTTTATVLAQCIYNSGFKMKSAGFDLEGLKEGIALGTDVALSSLKSQKRDVSDEEDLKKVALISANGEKEISELIVSAIKAAGVDGEVVVEEAKGFKSSLEIVDGYQVERGFLSPYFVTDKEKSVCEFKDPLILMSDASFSSIHDVMKPLEAALDLNKPILIVASDVEGDSLQGLVLNKVKGSLRVCAIKSPGFGATRHELLNDLQSIVGGRVLESSFDMSEFDPNMFGTCKRAIVQKTSSLFITEDSRSKESLSRIAAIKEQLQNPGLSANERELCSYRLKQLSGAIAILRVGASTEAELIERHDRVDDALHATKAALQEGILPGGGVALVRAAKEIDMRERSVDNPAVRAGLSIVRDACTEPFKQIVRNGSKNPDSYLEKIQEQKDNIGFDFRSDRVGDMFELGIVDPLKVTRCALENASSAASILLSVGSAMIELDKD